MEECGTRSDADLACIEVVIRERFEILLVRTARIFVSSSFFFLRRILHSAIFGSLPFNLSVGSATVFFKVSTFVFMFLSSLQIAKEGTVAFPCPAMYARVI